MLEMEPALPADVPALLELRDDAARWMAGQGIRQWSVGEVSAELIAASVERGEYWVARATGIINGSLQLIWSDPDVWGERPDDAGYVHGLVVARTTTGGGLGRQMLEWAGARTASIGREFLRLDCVQSNLELRAYYARTGFTEVGRADTHYGPVVLWERPANPD